MISRPDILFSDDALLVVHKPAGLLAVPDGYDPNKPHLRGVLESVYGRLWIIHRLDKGTSGVIVLARTAEAHRDINNQFSKGQVEKSYQAIIIGTPGWDEKTLQAPIRANVGRRKRSIVDPLRGKDAATSFQVLTRFKDHTLVEARPKTGRTHQIRVHLYNLGHPVLSDPLYGAGKTTPLINRLALHAYSLGFNHPQSAKPLKFSTPPPSDFKAALEKLRTFP